MDNIKHPLYSIILTVIAVIADLLSVFTPNLPRPVQIIPIAISLASVYFLPVEYGNMFFALYEYISDIKWKCEKASFVTFAFYGIGIAAGVFWFFRTEKMAVPIIALSFFVIRLLIYKVRG